MADTPTTLSLVTLAQEYRGDVVRNINRKTVALRLLRLVPGAGKNMAWAPEGDGQNAENYTEGADAANFGSDTQASAVLNWGLYRSNFHLTELAMDAAASSSSPTGNRALWARNLVNATSKLASTLNTAVFSGAGTGTTMAGLEAAIGSTSNTYAGIDRSQAGNAYFRPYVVDPGVATALTLASLRLDIAAIYVACGSNPDVALCSPSVFNKVVELFDATRRYVQNINTSGGSVALEAQQAGVEVDGVVFIKDKDAVEGTIYYLSLDDIEMEYLPGAAERLMLSAGMGVDANDGFGMFPMGMKYAMLAKNGASERAMVSTSLQLKVKRPNAFGVRRNVAIT